MATRRSASGLTDLGPVERIPLGEGREVRVGTLNLAVFRARTGEVYATQAACPHRGGPLADGIIGGGLVVCPLHEFKFELRTGRSVGNTCPSLATFGVEVQEGRLFLDLGPAVDFQAS